jgi:hypothetical protein
MRESWVQAPQRKRKPQKATAEGMLLLSIVIIAALLVGSILFVKHPAASVTRPVEQGTAVDHW